jgi:hypothetical protein
VTEAQRERRKKERAAFMDDAYELRHAEKRSQEAEIEKLLNSRDSEMEIIAPEGPSLMEVAARVAGFKHVVNEPKWEVK